MSWYGGIYLVIQIIKSRLFNDVVRYTITHQNGAADIFFTES